MKSVKVLESSNVEAIFPTKQLAVDAGKMIHPMDLKDSRIVQIEILETDGKQ